MHITTTSYCLSLGEDHVYSLRKLGVAGDDSWVESRRGEAFDRHLKVKLHETSIELFFENKSIGFIPLTQKQSVMDVVNLVHYWNHHIGPTDLLTIKTTELIRDWNQLMCKQKLRTKCVTYNCAGLLGEMALKRETWVTLIGKEDETALLDVIVLSFQESDSLKSVKNNYVTLQRVCDLSKAYLFKTHKLISSVQLLGLMTVVFVKHSLVPYVSHVSTDTSSTGFLRVWGNKGAVKTRFFLYRDPILGNGLELVFINCHLSAGEGVTQLSRRKWELREIGNKFGIPGLAQKGGDEEQDGNDSISSISDEEELAEAKPPVPENSEEANLSDTESIANLEADTGMRHAEKYIVLMGDLNYRILLSETETKRKINSKEWEGLLSNDSLSLERRQGLVFNEFEEAQIHFAPTYKYEIGTSKFKERIPSYTDRIMYRTKCPTTVEQYTSASEFQSSDHRPVLLTSDVESSLCVDIAKRDEVVQRAMMIADIAENNSQPKIDVEEQQLTLKGPPLSVQYQYITIKNKGSRPVKWVIENAHIEAERVKRDSVPDIEPEGPESRRGSSVGTPNAQQPTPTHRRVNSRGDTLTNGTTSPRPDAGTSDKADASRAFDSINTSINIGSAVSRLPLRQNSLALTPMGDVSVTPGDGSVSASKPSADALLEARVGIQARDIILLVRPQMHTEGIDMGGAAGQKYVFVKIEPTRSCLGQPLRNLELSNGVPIVFRRCVEYLYTKRSVPRLFLVQAEPRMFQQVLEWLDTNQLLDTEVLNAADQAVSGSGTYAVAQVLLAMFFYLPDQLLGPSAKRKVTAQKWKEVIQYICTFLNTVIDNTNAVEVENLDVWAEALYDRTDKKAGANEKRAYLRSMLIIAEKN